jgi:hypothetical protein
MDYDQRCKTVIEFISNHQHCTAQYVVDELKDKISRATIFNILKELSTSGIIKDNKDHENSRDHKLSVDINNPLVSIPKELDNLRDYFFSLLNKTKVFLEIHPDLHETEYAYIIGIFNDLMHQTLRLYTHRAFIGWPRQIRDHKTLGKLHAEFSTRITEIERATEDLVKQVPISGAKSLAESNIYALEETALRDLMIQFEQFRDLRDESRRLLNYLLVIREQDIKSRELKQFYKKMCKIIDSGSHKDRRWLSNLIKSQ